MGKALDASIPNAALTKFATATELWLTTAQPSGSGSAARTSAIALSLNSAVAMTGADFTQAAGDASGRKVTYAAKTVPITVAGTATQVAFGDGAIMLGTTTIASTAVNVGDTVNLASSKLEIADPT